MRDNSWRPENQEACARDRHSRELSDLTDHEYQFTVYQAGFALRYINVFFTPSFGQCIMVQP